MAHPYRHAVRSARLFGARPDDDLPIDDWLDASRAHIADVRHRALRHHSEGIFPCEAICGRTLTNSGARPLRRESLSLLFQMSMTLPSHCMPWAQDRAAEHGWRCKGSAEAAFCGQNARNTR